MSYRLNHVTITQHCYWWEFWSRDSDVLMILTIIYIKKKKIWNLNNYWSKPEFFRLLWDIVVLRLVPYLLNMICLKLTKSENSDRSRLTPKMFRFQPIYPLSFFLYSPFQMDFFPIRLREIFPLIKDKIK